jgi:hypothetical protein
MAYFWINYFFTFNFIFYKDAVISVQIQTPHWWMGDRSLATSIIQEIQRLIIEIVN